VHLLAVSDNLDNAGALSLRPKAERDRGWEICSRAYKVIE
jgi:hypothetical protein